MPYRGLFLSICVSLGCLISTRPSDAPDCNANGRDDVVDISQGHSTDCNANEIPDECEESLLRFAAESGPTLSSGADLAVAADWDRDGRPDLVTAHSTSDASSVTVFQNLEDGLFEEVLNAVEQITFSGKLAVENEQPVRPRGFSRWLLVAPSSLRGLSMRSRCRTSALC